MPCTYHREAQGDAKDNVVESQGRPKRPPQSIRDECGTLEGRTSEIQSLLTRGKTAVDFHVLPNLMLHGLITLPQRLDDDQQQVLRLNHFYRRLENLAGGIGESTIVMPAKAIDTRISEMG